MIKNEKDAFVLRLGERKEEALANNVIGVGWAKAKNLDKEREWEKFKNIVREAYPDQYKDSPRALGNASGSLYLFIHSMKEGDYIVVPVSGAFHVGVIHSSEIEYDESQIDSDFAWRRRVEWKTQKPIPRAYVNNDLQKRLKARQTCVIATDLMNEIIESLTRKERKTLRQDIINKSKEDIANSLLQTINDRELEELVKQLAIASGARAEILARQQKSDGDIDVLATYDLKIAQEEATVRVAYQVKQHSGISDVEAVQQLLTILKDNQRVYDKACAVTTAKQFSDDAYKLAKDNDIIMVAQEQLVEWLLYTGLEKIDL